MRSDHAFWNRASRRNVSDTRSELRKTSKGEMTKTTEGERERKQRKSYDKRKTKPMALCVCVQRAQNIQCTRAYACTRLRMCLVQCSTCFEVNFPLCVCTTFRFNDSWFLDLFARHEGPKLPRNRIKDGVKETKGSRKIWWGVQIHNNNCFLRRATAMRVSANGDAAAQRTCCRRMNRKKMCFTRSISMRSTSAPLLHALTMRTQIVIQNTVLKKKNRAILLIERTRCGEAERAAKYSFNAQLQRWALCAFRPLYGSFASLVRILFLFSVIFVVVVIVVVSSFVSRVRSGPVRFFWPDKLKIIVASN